MKHNEIGYARADGVFARVVRGSVGLEVELSDWQGNPLWLDVALAPVTDPYGAAHEVMQRYDEARGAQVQVELVAAGHC